MVARVIVVPVGHANHTLYAPTLNDKALACAFHPDNVVLSLRDILGGLAGGLVHAGMAGSWAGVGDLLAAALVQVPAALALGGFVVALFGLLPRWSGPLAWAALAVALVMGQLGSLLDLPQWALNLSPFTHVPRVPAEAFSVTPVILLLLAAVALGAVGFAAFSRRDLAIGA